MASKIVRVRYQPFSSQEAFHLGDERIKGYMGGWGSGKTFAGAKESLKLSIINKGADGFVCAPTHPMLKRVTWREFVETLPHDLIRREVKGDRYIELVHGGRVYYGSASSPESLEGTNLAWFWLDEGRLAAYEAFKILLGRLRSPKATRLQGIITSTPATGWLYDELGKGKQDRGLYNGRTSDNYHLDPSFLKNLKSTLSEDAYEIYANGNFANLSGGVFKNFSTQENCCPLEYNENYPVDIAIDFGYRHPAVLFVQHIKRCQEHQVEDCIHILDEEMPDDCPTLKLAPIIRQKLRQNRWYGNDCFVDPAGRAKNVQEGLSDTDYLEAAGFICHWTTHPSNTNIPNGIEIIRTKIKNTSGQRALYISDHMLDSKRGIVKSLIESAYPEPHKGNPEEPIKDGKIDHARDALRYYIVNKFPVRDFFSGVIR